jgi:hypothetical protein
VRKRMELVSSNNNSIIIITINDWRIHCHLHLPDPRNQQDLRLPPNDVVVGRPVGMTLSDTSRVEKGQLLPIATEFKEKSVWEHLEES